jgi:hypothetical protein
MGKKGGSQTVTTAPDAATQAWTQQVRNAASAAAGSPPPGVGAGTQAAGGFYNQAMGAGSLGFGAMSGDPNSIAKLMNPYLSNVVDANNADWANINKQTANQTDDAATRAGAFGGSRAAIAQGAALSTNNIAQGQQLAQLRASGYQNAMGQANNLANLGFSGAQGAQGISDYTRNVGMQSDPNNWRYAQLMGAANLPGGSTQTMTGQPGRSPLNGALGGAAIGAKFGPWGAGIGAVGGGLLSMF